MWHMTDCQQKEFWLIDAKKVSRNKVRSEISSKDIDAGDEIAILLEQRQ